MNWSHRMKPFNYDPLKDNAPKSITTSQKRLLAEIGQKAISDMTRKISSNENAAMNGRDIPINDVSTQTPGFDEIFRPLAATGLLKITDGKVLLRTNTNIESLSSGLMVLGAITIGVIFKSEGLSNETVVTFCVVGLISLLCGILLKKAFASYSVFDNKQHKAYTECFFFSKSIYKSKAISKNEIQEIGVDHRKIEGSLVNTSNAMNEGRNAQREPFESAIVYLLKNGKLSYFNSFTNWNGANEFYMHVAISMSAVWCLAFKNSEINTKFMVKRLRGKPALYPTDLNEVNAVSIFYSIVRIIIGVAVALGSIILVFWLIYKFV